LSKVLNKVVDGKTNATDATQELCSHHACVITCLMPQNSKVNERDNFFSFFLGLSQKKKHTAKKSARKLKNYQLRQKLRRGVMATLALKRIVQVLQD
jgi:hypothetical protein